MEKKYIDNIELRKNLKNVLYDIYSGSNYDYKTWFNSFKDYIKYYKVSKGNLKMLNEINNLMK